MAYISVKQMAEKWNISERSVRNYCKEGKISGAFMTGKTWNIPEDAVKPIRKQREDSRRTLGKVLTIEKANRTSGGIYHKIQIELTYNSNHIEGSKLTHDQTRYIYDTNTIGREGDAVNVDDIIETVNHFRAIDYIIEKRNRVLTEKMIKELHFILKSGTSDSRKNWFAVGDYKREPNEVAGQMTIMPEEVPNAMKKLMSDYHSKKEHNLDEILEFHFRFERIHPFQDGNGRVGRLIMFKECLKNNIVPFIISDELKYYYYRGLAQWKEEKGYLRDTCLTAQDRFKEYLDYFRIEYDD